MKISGNIFIADKYGSKEKDIENRGKVAYGKLTWSDKMKPAKGEEYKSFTTKQFICFGENVEIMYSCRTNLLYIEGFLKTEHFTDKEGKTAKSDKIFVSKVMLAEQADKQSKPKAGNGYVDDDFGGF